MNYFIDKPYVKCVAIAVAKSCIDKNQGEFIKTTAVKWKERHEN